MGQEIGPKAENEKTETVTKLSRKTREDIYIEREKWDQTDSPEMPDKT